MHSIYSTCVIAATGKRNPSGIHGFWKVFPGEIALKPVVISESTKKHKFNESFSGSLYPSGVNGESIPERYKQAMSNANKDFKPTKYMIRVKSHLDIHWENWFDGMTIKLTEDGHTILTGEIIDQSALYGLLEKIRNLNLTLISVQQIDG